MSDTPWEQACLPTNKTRVGKRRSADQVNFDYVDSLFQYSVPVEKLTCQNSTEDSHLLRQLKNWAQLRRHILLSEKFRKNLITQLTTTC